MESAPEVIQVIEVSNLEDYTYELSQVVQRLSNIEEVVYYLGGFALFGVVVLLCYFCYKFFKIFI